MRAFHGKEEIKKRYLERVRGHRLNREIIHGYYWADGRGCAVGATIHGRDLFAYERELGIPASLAGLKDRIFEGMPNADAVRWPEDFLSAIRPGTDLSNVWPLFAVWLLEHPADGVVRFANTKDMRELVTRVASLYRQVCINASESWLRAEAHAAAEAAKQQVNLAKQNGKGGTQVAARLSAAETAEAAAVALWAPTRWAPRWIQEVSESAAVTEAIAEGPCWVELAVHAAENSHIRQSLKLLDLLRAA